MRKLAGVSLKLTDYFNLLLLPLLVFLGVCALLVGGMLWLLLTITSRLSPIPTKRPLRSHRG